MINDKFIELNHKYNAFDYYKDKQLVDTLEKYSEYYYLRGTRPTKDKYVNG